MHAQNILSELVSEQAGFYLRQAVKTRAGPHRTQAILLSLPSQTEEPPIVRAGP